MTKEKLAIKLAIDIMERNVSKYINHGIYKVSDADGAVHVEFGEAINILNGMLEQEPCEDAISRAQAIEAMYSIHKYGKEGVKDDLKCKSGSDAYFSETILDAVEKLEDLPHVTPIRPKGEWKCDHKIAYFQDRYVCSECGSEQYFTRDTITNFCPDCGADMRGEKE